MERFTKTRQASAHLGLSIGQYDIARYSLLYLALKICHSRWGALILLQRILRPVLFYLHGGGLVSLSTAAYDKLVRRMTNLMGNADGVVVSIDYRQGTTSTTSKNVQVSRDVHVCLMEFF